MYTIMIKYDDDDRLNYTSIMVLCKMKVMSMMLLMLITSVVLQGPRAVESKGERCMFREALLAEDELQRNTFHTIQSAAPQGFYIGFNLAPRSTFALLGEGRTGRGAMARVGWRRPGQSCGFRFTGERKRRRKNKQDVLLDSILQYIEDNEVGRSSEGEVVRIEGTLEEKKEEERLSDVNSVDIRRRGGRGRRRGLKRPKVRHLSKKQLRPNRREKNRRREKKSKRKPSMRRRPRQ